MPIGKQTLSIFSDQSFFAKTITSLQEIKFADNFDNNRYRLNIKFNKL